MRRLLTLVAVTLLLTACDITDPEQWVTDRQHTLTPVQHGYTPGWPCDEVPCQCPTGTPLTQADLQWRWKIINGQGAWEYTTPCTDQWIRTDR